MIVSGRQVAVALVALLLVLVALGLLLAFLSDPLAKKIVGFVVFGIGAIGGLVWAAVAFGSYWRACGPDASRLQLGKMASFEQEQLLGRWTVLASSDWKYEPPQCDSSARFFKVANNMYIENCCRSLQTRQVTGCATAALASVAADRFAASYFPGVYAQLSVKHLDNDLLVLGSGDKAWVLRKQRCLPSTEVGEDSDASSDPDAETNLIRDIEARLGTTLVLRNDHRAL